MATQPKCARCNGTGEEPDAVAIGAEMRTKRLTARKTQAEIAGIMDLSTQYISDLEAGKRLFDRELIEKYERAVRKK